MFTSIRANHFLRRNSINWSFIWLRVIPLSFLTLVALIPTYYYIDDNFVGWLPLMAIIIWIPRPLLAIRTIVMGIQSVRQDMIQGGEKTLLLTGNSVQKIIRRKWAAIVRQTFPDQILFALPSIGLTLGISQFFLSTKIICGDGQTPPIPDLYPLIMLFFHPYCYGSYNASVYYVDPSSIVFLLGIFIIVIMAFSEACLNASISLVAGFSRFAAKEFRIIYGAMIRLGLLFAILLSIPLMQDYLRYNLDCRNFMVIRTNICPFWPQGVSLNLYMSFCRTYETIQVAVVPLFDQGILLAANVMRPNDDRLLEIKLHPVGYKAPQITFLKNDFDNRPFVLRNLMGVVLTGFLYWLLIRYFLRHAAYFALLNHGASGYLEL